MTHDQADEALDKSTVAVEAQAAAAASAHAETTADDALNAALAKAQAEAADFKDKLLRTLADMENLRRRTEKDAQDARAYGATKLARDMLTVADNMRRAIDAVPAEAKAAGDTALKGLIEGIELTERDFLKSLETHGVKRIDPKGEKFDPNLHQAMFEAQNPDLPNGHVMEVIQPGYTISGRVLRPALVGVARGGPKAEGPAANGGAS